MPNLPAHVELAWRAASELFAPVISENLGHYLLGATAPDVRIITQRPRSDYHFVELDFSQIGEGAAGMFAAHPELRAPRDNAKIAFVAGYLTHLVADETWIVTMYRRYFDGNGTDSAKLFDRAAQLVLDREAEERVRSLLPLVSETECGFEAGPIAIETMSEWRDWVVDFLGGSRPFQWERLRHMAGRIAGGDLSHPAHAMAERFLSNVEEGVSELYGVVPKSVLDDYKGQCIERLTETVLEYVESAQRASVPGRRWRQST